MRVSVSEGQLRAAIEMTAGDPAFAESAELVRAGKRPMELLQALAVRPEILKAFGAFSDCVYPGGLIERSVKEYVIIEASRRNECQFCRDSHVAFARSLGVSDDPLRALERPEGLTERERVAVEYTAAAMADSVRLPDELFERVRAVFSEEEVVELTFLIGYINLLNLFNNCLRVTYRGEAG